MDKLWIRAFRPVDDPQSTAEFLRGHEKVLLDIGVTTTIAEPTPWTADPGVHVIVAEHEEHGMIGGIRIQPAHKGSMLPMEAAISKLDPAVHDVMRFLTDRGTAEICGLWNAHRFANRGLPHLLSMAAVSMAQELELQTLVCFVAYYTLRHAKKCGFVPLESIGDKGAFTYPIPSIRSIAMVVPDALSLASAPAHYRSTILSLRTRPIQERFEDMGGAISRVRYLLQPSPVRADLTAYGRIQQERLLFIA